MCILRQKDQEQKKHRAGIYLTGAQEKQENFIIIPVPPFQDIPYCAPVRKQSHTTVFPVSFCFSYLKYKCGNFAIVFPDIRVISFFSSPHLGHSTSKGGPGIIPLAVRMMVNTSAAIKINLFMA